MDEVTGIKEKRYDPFAAVNQKTQEIIESQNVETERILDLLEQNYRNFLEAQITYHEYLMKSAKEKGDGQLYSHHKVMFETYQATLANLNNSSKFGTK